MYARYALFAAASLLANLFVWLTCPIWAAIAAIGDLRRLPGPLALLHTHDDDIYGSGLTREPVPEKLLARWKRAMWWMCRNPGYGFDAYVLGMPAGTPLLLDETQGQFDSGHAAIRKTLWAGGYFGYRRDLPLWSGRYVKMWFGWHYEPKGDGSRHMLKISLNPFRRLA